MSEIPFVNALADALETAIASDQAKQGRHAGWRVLLPRGRGRLMAVVAVLAFGGVAAAASLLPLNTTQVAAAGIRCVEGTGFTRTGSIDLAVCDPPSWIGSRSD